MSARSYLYVPGDRPDRLAKAADRAGDAILADLEDAVAPGAKAAALDEVLQWLADSPAPGREIWVRVNAGPQGLDEIAALRAQPRLSGVVLPKADARSTRAAVEAAGPDLPVAGLVESARGVLEAAAVAGTAGVSHLGIGEVDLCAELGLTPSSDERELLPLRMQVVLASAAAGLPAPTGPVHRDLRDVDGLRTSTEALRRLGFGARSAIHPAQVAVIEEVFTPTPAEVEAARAVVASYDASHAAGTGVVVDEQGRMVDEAVVRSARRLLARVSS
jgi:citrate lyase subunit beta/citryl-CoA lyase